VAESHTPPAARISLPPLGWAAAIVAGMLLVAMVVLIAAQLAVLQDSRRHIEAQDGKAQLLIDKAHEVDSAAQPALRDARPLIRDARDAIGPLTESGGQISTAVQALPALVTTGQAVAARSIPVLEALGRGDLATLVQNGNVALAALLYRGRLERIAAHGDALLGELAKPGFLRDIRRGAQAPPRLETLMRRLLKVQRATLRAQLASLEVQRESLAVQQETRDAANSIDRKTGGRAPAAAPAAP
jgi:hypothetical protein